mmetsp:Transcript_21408/g.29735  ORF Transcript_21408/g.29735 Transcript_21408/m.29735 type:complete len:328 (+) Transcript_21408:95-1078(+)|eukprot:CAMPEP_0196586472 /NCGR_PEP_ID=MMETSP1081-20130531/54415_1 /TAXON_ID=36882 /ORGANISM="Pyramimonas amylifera, Strain CCMP720" /LENGTH=327 /DNA_ID=CAMNT_0041908369 /DNA_START=84 /DNA_END=1067 /DNA_ORIENTATION=-
MKVIIGVDGGGTKTTCVCVNFETDEILSTFSVGSTNANSVGVAVARSNLETGIATSLSDAMKTSEEVLELLGISLSMSGVDRPTDEEKIKGWLEPLYPNQVPIIINNDAIGALASGTKGKLEGSCVLIAGTGTISLAVTHQGQRNRASGWGPLLGDGGSGFWLGSQALAAAARSADGRASGGAKLLEAIQTHLKIPHPADLVTWAYSEIGWAHVAALAPVVIQAAREGDEVAGKIINDGVEQLCDSVEAAAASLFEGASGLYSSTARFTLVLVGGLIQDGGFITQRLKLRLSERIPAADPVHPMVSPAVGAALIAKEFIKKKNDDVR